MLIPCQSVLSNTPPRCEEGAKQMLLALVGRRVGKRGGAACEDSLQRSGKKLESGPLQVLRHDVGELELGGDS